MVRSFKYCVDKMHEHLQQTRLQRSNLCLNDDVKCVRESRVFIFMCDVDLIGCCIQILSRVVLFFLRYLAILCVAHWTRDSKTLFFSTIFSQKFPATCNRSEVKVTFSTILVFKATKSFDYMSILLNRCSKI